MIRNKANYCQWGQQFTRVFETNVAAFWQSPLTGFEIFAFDDWLITRFDSYRENWDTMAMIDIVRQEYGDQGVAIIRGLIGSDRADKEEADHDDGSV